MAPSSDQARRDIQNAIKTRCGGGMGFAWVEEVIGKVTFKLNDSIKDAAQYTAFGTTISFKSEYYPDGKTFSSEKLPQMIHELWHAYWDIIAEEKETELGKEIRRQFEVTE